MKLKDGYVVKDIVGNIVVIPIGQVLMDGGKNESRCNFCYRS